MALTIEEFCICENPCKYFESDWNRICNLVAFWYFKKNYKGELPIDPICETLANFNNFEFNPVLSYFVLSFLPRDISYQRLRENIFEILWEKDLEKADLSVIFESFKNNITQDSDLREIQHLLESLYEKYKIELFSSIKLTEEFYGCLQLLNCRVCGTHDTIDRTVKLRNDSEIYYPLHIFLDIKCQICQSQSTNVDIPKERQDLQSTIVNFLKDVLRDYMEHPDNLPFQSAYKALLSGIVNHCSWSWKEESIFAIAAIFRIIFKASVTKLQYDSGRILFVFAKNLTPGNRSWPMIQQTLLNNFEEIIDKKMTSSVEYVIYALESLLKIIPFHFVLHVARLICKIALFNNLHLLNTLRHMMKRVTSYREISEHQLAKQCVSVFKEVICENIECHQVIIQRFSEVFNLSYIEIFKMILPTIFINLVIKGDNDAHSDINRILESATWLKPNESNFNRVIDSLVVPDSIVYFFLHCTVDKISEIKRFLESHLGLKLEKLIAFNDVSRTIHLLMFHLSEKPTNVHAGLKWIAVDVLNVEGIPDRISRINDFGIDKLSKFLREYSVGILDFFKLKLLDETLSLQEQEKAVSSLEEFLRLIKTGLKKVHIMCFSILKICSKFTSPRLIEKSYALWNEFIFLLDCADLEGLLVESIAVLLYFEKPLINKIKDILKYVFNKVEQMKTKICDLHFIFEFPSLIEYHRKMQKIIAEVNIHDDIFISTLICINRNLRHDSSCVRHLAANNLFTVLSTNMERLSLLMTIFKQENENNIHNMELIHSLNHSLISAITKDSGNITIIFGRCLGLLGAVDPGRYRELIVSSSNEKPTEFVTSQRFSYSILCELGKVYLGTNNTNQMDAAAASIQDMLKLFKIPGSCFTSNPSSDTINTLKLSELEQPICAFNKLFSGQELWDVLSSQTKEIFQPFLHSRYILNYTPDWSNVTSPILTLSEGMELDDWICTWTGYLLHLMKNPEHISVFSNLKLLIKNDPTFSKYILPHIILVLLIENDSKVIRIIHQEIIWIFKTICQDDENRNLLNMERLLNNSCTLILSDISHNSLCNSENKILQSASQIIFNVLDYLKSWMNMIRSEIIKEDNPINSRNHGIVSSFLSSVPNNLLAMASYNCGSLARSIQHWKLAYRSNLIKTESEDDVSQDRKGIILGLLKSQLALKNYDEVSGYLSTFKSDLEPFAQTSKLEYEGKYDLALSIYEQQLMEHSRKEQDNQYSSENIDLYLSIFRCQLFNVSTLPSVISRVECCLNDEKFPLKHYESIHNFGIEALYKLGNWKKLEEFLNLEDYSNDNWTFNVSKAMCYAKNQKPNFAQSTLNAIWKKAITNLEVSSIEGYDYARVHSDLSRFAMLTEIEMILATKTICTMNPSNITKYFDKISLKMLPNFLNQRYKLSETNFVNQESLLTSHYNLFQLISEVETEIKEKNPDNPRSVNMTFINDQIGEIWLQRCKVARRAGRFTSAMACLLNVEKFDYIEFSIERGKLLWKMGQIDESLGQLDEVIDKLTPPKSGNRYVRKPKDKLDRFWKLLLLRAYLSDLTRRYDLKTTRELYESVFEFHPQSEVAHFRLAYYLDCSMKVANQDNKSILLLSTIKEYGHALTYGSKFVYQSMPRLISLWLDEADNSTNAMPINTIMKKHIKRIPKFQFYIALAQILSRLCLAKTKEILDLLDQLVIKICIAYPQQTIWSLLILEGSSIELRRSTFGRIVELIKKEKKEMSEYIYRMTILSAKLREISELEPSPNNKYQINLKRIGKSVSAVLKSGEYSKVIIPLNCQINGTLPTPAAFKESYSPFPSKYICIYAISDSVEVLQSVTKPKKMVWLGSDGKKYFFVNKPKDDLRRDFRIMELNNMFNRLMRRNSETRHRLLYIRTYAVTPLGETGGLIEWVNNTESLKNLIGNVHCHRGTPVLWARYYAAYPDKDLSAERKYYKFMKDVLPLYPEVFHYWFLLRFPEPGSWYQSLQKYFRSAGVMSMVGYILGLGDRHFENILFDYTTGDIVHIDFNCLFEQGKLLQVPEVVPFRLTRNLQDALGPCRENNGLFRSSCVATLRLLRDEIDPIMAVFRPMLSDTLIEVKYSKNSSNKFTSSWKKTETILAEMEGRLRGNVNQLPLSVEGQVNYLIAQAVDNKLLCQMFNGWGSYI